MSVTDDIKDMMTDECCPDFSCCRPALKWDAAKRKRFIESGQGAREKMMMGALGSLMTAIGVNAHVTRGNPNDHE
jgi:hypothetical protein